MGKSSPCFKKLYRSKHKQESKSLVQKCRPTNKKDIGVLDHRREKACRLVERKILGFKLAEIDP